MFQARTALRAGFLALPENRLRRFSNTSSAGRVRPAATSARPRSSHVEFFEPLLAFFDQSHAFADHLALGAVAALLNELGDGPFEFRAEVDAGRHGGGSPIEATE